MTTNTWAAAAKRVIDAETDNFTDLIGLSGLLTKEHLRYQDWSGVSFRGCDLRGFDFSAARLIGCDFTHALIEGARFDQAEIDAARPDAELDPKRTTLGAASDWEAYRNGWRRLRTPHSDEHLPVGAVFQDAPIAPEMVVIPAGTFWMDRVPAGGVRVAVMA